MTRLGNYTCRKCGVLVTEGGFEPLRLCNFCSSTEKPMKPKHYRRTFWRPKGRIWHAFSDFRRGVYHAICDGKIYVAANSIARVCRPPSVLRCPRCDGIEMDRYGVEQGLDATAGWEDLARKEEARRTGS